MRSELTTLEQLILQAVAAGGRRAHNRYLPEVLALYAKGRVALGVLDQTGIDVFPANEGIAVPS